MEADPDLAMAHRDDSWARPKLLQSTVSAVHLPPHCRSHRERSRISPGLS
jgi:hypothetical protein